MGTDKLVSLYSVYKSSLWAAIGMVNRRFWLAMHAAPVSSLLFANEIVNGQMSTLFVPWHHTQGRHPGITVTMKPFTGADQSCRGCHIPTVSHCLTESWSQLLKNRGYTYYGFPIRGSERLGVSFAERHLLVGAVWTLNTWCLWTVVLRDTRLIVYQHPRLIFASFQLAYYESP